MTQNPSSDGVHDDLTPGRKVVAALPETTPAPSQPTVAAAGDDVGSVVAPADFNRICPVCSTRFWTTSRGIFCSQRCRQRSYRLRHLSIPEPEALARELRRRRALTAHTVYECEDCDHRQLGEWFCSECHKAMRKLGPGGNCPGCDEVILIADLLD